MAIEIRPFGGTPEELATFISKHWRIQYETSGYAPVLSPDYFRWMTPPLAAGDPSNIIAAYDGGTLVGVMPSDPLPFVIAGEPVLALAREYLTVHSDQLRGGIGRMLREGLAARGRAIGARFAIGFVNSGGWTGKGRLFWNSQPGRRIVINRPRGWIRMLDGARVAAAMQERSNRLPARITGIIGQSFGKTGRAAHVRPYRPDDLAACHAVFANYMKGFDLAYGWGVERLGHHLGFPGLASTLVHERPGGGIAGFATYYVFDALGRQPVRNAIIDTFMPESMTVSERVGLLRAAVEQARARDAHLIMVMGPPVNSVAVLLAARFIPIPGSEHLLCAIFDPTPALKDVRRPFSIFR